MNEAKENGPYDVIIVPGFPHDSLNKWDKTTKGRIFWAKYLLDNNIAKKVMFSGSAVYTPYVEAKAMAMYAKALGIPDSVIHLETKAEHSTENVFYSYYLAKSMGYNKIAIATDPFQAKMVAAFIRKRLDGKVDQIPFSFAILHNMEKQIPVIEDDSLYISNFVPITERQTFRYRFRGTRGKNIDYSAYGKP